MMRVLVTGAHGQVGCELTRGVPSGFKVIALSSSDLDITDAAQVNSVVALQRPDLIINAAAYTAVDKAEENRVVSYAVNRDGTANLALAAARQHIPVLHISTDYVFDGHATRPYTEDDPAGPTGVYGTSKLAGELMLSRTNPRHIILRTSWVFGAQGHNFVKTMLRLANERDQLSVVADQTGCPTSASSIADTLWRIAQRYRDEGDIAWGTYHFSGTRPCTWHDFALQIFQDAYSLGMLKRIPTVSAIDTRDYPTPAKRPAWSVLDCAKIARAFDIKPKDWKQELQSVLSELKAGD